MAKVAETKKALIVVRTYPSPAKQGVEVSCTAAITDKGEWLRLFPVPWRYLDEEKRFRKYQWIEASVTKAKDHRPESYRLNADSIKIITEPLSTVNEWAARKAIVFPLRGHCLCCLQKIQQEKGSPTLGIIRPRVIERLVIKAESPNWNDSQLQILRQGHLFQKAPVQELEKIPFKFSYQFRCDHDECSGHTIICTDWEMGESWRKWSRDYGDRWEENFRNRYEKEMIEKYDTHFYMGTVHQHPNTWIIVGLFYPPKLQSLTLFE